MESNLAYCILVNKCFNSLERYGKSRRSVSDKFEYQITPAILECVHLRGGWCVNHGQFARKVARVVKSWKILKSGQFGREVEP